MIHCTRHPARLGQLRATWRKMEFGEQILPLPACGDLHGENLPLQLPVSVYERFRPAISPLGIAGNAGKELPQIARGKRRCKLQSHNGNS